MMGAFLDRMLAGYSGSMHTHAKRIAILGSHVGDLRLRVEYTGAYLDSVDDLDTY